MASHREPLPRPQPRTPYAVLVRNRRVLADWEQLVSTRRDVCIRCWDHLANDPHTSIGSRYLPLKRDQRWVEFAEQRLPQWQYEIDRGARVKVAIGPDFVVVVAVSAGHPKANE
ncbi:MAG TPA: hypothetical protein VFW96_03605 [Thermomicrobiales bacterium]|nr:hypothetical protein [Thermomicrobiales bacterium]